MRYIPVIIIGRVVRAVARIRARGGGTGIPGLVMNKIAPRFLTSTLNAFPSGLVVVSGTSGKSTTTKMVVSILEAHGMRVFTNPSTANISQGITSAILEKSDVRGRIDADIAVVEMDEAFAALLSDRLDPRVVVLTNVMLDALERFHSAERIAGMLKKIATRATEALVLNRDDAALVELAPRANRGVVSTNWYGVAGSVMREQRHGLGYAQTASERLELGRGTIVTEVEGRSATYDVHGELEHVTLPARGTHYAVDAAGALEASRALLGHTFDLAHASKTLSSMRPVFGRGEIVTLRGEDVEFVLVQNSSSFQLNLDHLGGQPEQLFVAIGSEEADPSWLWKVDMASLSHVTIVSGIRAEEIALRLMYEGIQLGDVDRDLGAALDRFLAMPAPQSGLKTVVFSSDSMRRTRHHLGLTGPDEQRVTA